MSSGISDPAELAFLKDCKVLFHTVDENPVNEGFSLSQISTSRVLTLTRRSKRTRQPKSTMESKPTMTFKNRFQPFQATVVSHSGEQHGTGRHFHGKMVPKSWRSRQSKLGANVGA